MRSAASKVRVLPTSQALANEAARRLVRAAAHAVSARGRFTLALSGGQTPDELYQALLARGAEALPYGRMEVFWSDERDVPPSHPASNYRLAWERWLAHVPIQTRALHRIRGEARPLKGEAGRYARLLVRRLGAPPRVDLILLGIGLDGHTASLFPGSPALRSEALVDVGLSPLPPRQRITMTLPPIRSARAVLLLAAGASKARPVARALLDPPSERVPASLVRGLRVLWLLDAAAAALLPRSLRSPRRP